MARHTWCVVFKLDCCVKILTFCTQSTGGYYTFVVNQADGAIMALDTFSPQNAVNSHWKSILNGGKAKDEGLPVLRYMSDLVWGKWVEDNAKVKNLRVYAVHNVLNDETTAIVSRAMRNKLVPSLSAWPGTVFDKEKDPMELQALIGKLYSYYISLTLLTTSRFTHLRHNVDSFGTAQG